MIWKDSYKIGVQEVDDQHKELFERLNAFLRVVRGKETMEVKAEKVAETLAFMGEYVIVHFDSEEEIQRRYNYPNYETHRQIHERFKAEIAKFEDGFHRQFDEDLLQEFSGKLLAWLINHVADEDQRIGDYINKN